MSADTPNLNNALMAMLPMALVAGDDSVWAKACQEIAAMKTDMGRRDEELETFKRAHVYDESQRASVQICGLNPAQIQELILFAKSYGWRHPGDTP